MSPRARSSALPLGPAAEVGLILLTVGVPAALGGVHHATIGAATMLAAASVLALWAYRRQTHRGLRLPWFGAVLLGVTAFTALQMVPLPVGLLRLVAPRTVELLEVSLAGTGGWARCTRSRSMWAPRCGRRSRSAPARSVSSWPTTTSAARSAATACCWRSSRSACC